MHSSPERQVHGVLKNDDLSRRDKGLFFLAEPFIGDSTPQKVDAFFGLGIHEIRLLEDFQGYRFGEVFRYPLDEGLPLRAEPSKARLDGFLEIRDGHCRIRWVHRILGLLSRHGASPESRGAALSIAEWAVPSSQERGLYKHTIFCVVGQDG